MLALDEAIPRFLPETDFDLSPFQTGAVFLAALLNAVPEGHVAFCSLLRPPLSLSIDGTSRIEPYETYGRALLRTLPPLPAPPAWPPQLFLVREKMPSLLLLALSKQVLVERRKENERVRWTMHRYFQAPSHPALRPYPLLWVSTDAHKLHPWAVNVPTGLGPQCSFKDLPGQGPGYMADHSTGSENDRPGI